MYNFDCRLFTGYKPCEPYKRCVDCADRFTPRGVMLLMINLDAMGDVLRNTCLLPAMKRQYSESCITWVSDPRTCELLENNPLIDRIVPFGAEALLRAENIKYDEAFNIDKSIRAGALLNKVKAKIKRGFSVNDHGVILPVDENAGFAYELGLDDELKFLTNRRTDQDVSAEALGLDYRRDEYVFQFTDEEKREIDLMRTRLGIDPDRLAIGINTGCSEAFPYKRLTVKDTGELIRNIVNAMPRAQILLLGGPEDTRRNREIAQALEGKVIETPTNEGPRRGMMAVELADLVVSGDSLGMHMAIALKKQVVAWFGLSCEWEIDLYDRGRQIIADVDCRPCWRKSCDKSPKCFERVPLDQIVQAVAESAQAVGKPGGAAG